jgi:hypothetical protein
VTFMKLIVEPRKGQRLRSGLVKVWQSRESFVQR